MSEHRDRFDAGWHPQRSPFGTPALGVYMELSAEADIRADGERRWYVGDHDALWASMYLEQIVRRESWPDDAPPDVRAELDEALLRWHGALPFSEVERSIVA